jgi:hypothetical protein
LSFGNPVVFPFPAVQYIPLSITNMMEGTVKDSPRCDTMKIITGPDLVSWRTILKNDYGINLPAIYQPKTLPVLAINLKVTDVKYRGFFITMIGLKRQSYYQFFTIPADRFYKPKLFLEVFNSASEKLAQYSLFMPHNYRKNNIQSIPHNFTIL